MAPLVLVVDDHPQMGTLLRLILSRLGYTVITTQSTAETMQLLPTTTPDLILADYRLGSEPPGTLVLTLQHDLHTASIPLVVVTGDFEAEHTLRHAGIPVILKPFDQAGLHTLLTGILGV